MPPIQQPPGGRRGNSESIETTVGRLDEQIYASNLERSNLASQVRQIDDKQASLNVDLKLIMQKVDNLGDTIKFLAGEVGELKDKIGVANQLAAEVAALKTDIQKAKEAQTKWRNGAILFMITSLVSTIGQALAFHFIK